MVGGLRAIDWPLRSLHIKISLPTKHRTRQKFIVGGWLSDFSVKLELQAENSKYLLKTAPSSSIFCYVYC